MILNNYRALQFMRDMDDDLTTDTILELHRIVTDGTLDDPSAAGRFQTPGEDRVAVYDRNSDQLLHRPPPAEQLPQRVQALCDFANADGDSGTFIHPVIRALHNPEHEYTFHTHAASHTVTHETARNDLVPLAEMGLLERRRMGRQYLFTPHSQLAQRLKKAA